MVKYIRKDYFLFENKQEGDEDLVEQLPAYFHDLYLALRTLYDGIIPAISSCTYPYGNPKGE